MQEFTQDQVIELRSIEKTLLRRGEAGLRAQVQELIDRLKQGGVAGRTDDVRVVQAKRLFDRGFGRELDLAVFEAYLATMPEIPASLVAADPRFPILGLADPLLGLTRTCRLIGLRFAEFGYNDESAVPCDDRHADPTGPFWFRAHDGRRNRDCKPSDCRAEARHPVFSMTAMVGAMTFLHNPGVVEQGVHVLDCPGTLRRDWRDSCAYVGVWDGNPRLSLYGSVNADPNYGSGEFRRE